MIRCEHPTQPDTEGILTDETTPQSSAIIAGLLHDFGDAWQIQQVENSTQWVAVQRPVIRPARFYLADSAERDLLANDHVVRRGW
jgi:hypothetical protein